jgi:nucleoside-diphosphate-sugar epimerase
VWEELDRGRLEVAVVSPTWIYGPGDRTFVPELIENLQSGTLPYFRRRGEYRLGLVYIGNLTAAIRSILEHPEGMGRRYILTDEPAMTFRAFVDALAAEIGVSPPKVSLPYGLAYGAAGAMELWSRIVGREKRPLLTRQAVASLGNDVTYDTTPLHDLGYEQKYQFPETLELTLAHDGSQ